MRLPTLSQHLRPIAQVLGYVTMLAFVCVVAVVGPMECYARSSSRLPLDSFVAVDNLILHPLGIQEYFGSGFVAKKTPVGSLVVTAGHICLEGGSLPSVIRVHDNHGHVYVAQPVAEGSPDTDTCVLLVPDLDEPVAPIGPMPKVSDSVVILGCAEGLWSPGAVLTFDGRYGGKISIDDESVHIVTAPSAEGSSGGPVVDGMGRVFGIVVKVHAKFHHLVVLVDGESIKELVRKASDSLAVKQGAVDAAVIEQGSDQEDD